MIFRTISTLATLSTMFLLSSCGLVDEAQRDVSDAEKWSFGKDLNFLEKYADCLVLGENESFVALSPKLQGRVITSTLEGDEGYSLGWFNRSLLMSGEDERYLNLFGGEDRLWFGPEGSDYSIFFPQNSLFIAQNWKIPQELTKSEWKLVAKSKFQAKFEKDAEFTNAKGQTLKLKIDREVSYISKENASKILGVEIPESVKLVGFQSINKTTNKGEVAWNLDNGLLNMEVLSCFHANKSTYAFVPYKEGDQKQLGAIITDPYNEPVGDRLSVLPEFVRLRTDGTKIGEIFMNAKRSKNVIVSYDSQKNLLTIVTYLAPKSEKKYLTSAWKRTSDVFSGDALSVFNNGPAVQGSFFSEKFFETTTYSPALALAPNASQIHIQRTFHLKGSEYELNLILFKYLGLTIKQLRP